jgi:2-hydroxycyclohexanecarboxyl-CoA dehydrogenase
VTGGANGIGAAIARRLAEEGCAVGILDLDAATGQTLVAEIKAAGGRASLHTLDITDYDAVARAVEGFEASVGPVAFLVNNAGWDRAQSFLDTTPEFWRKVVAINLFGPLNVNHVVLRGMAARGFGRVVNIASDAGPGQLFRRAVYSACKGGIIAFARRSLASSWATVILSHAVPDRPTPPFRSFLEAPTAPASPRAQRAI